MLQRRRMQLGSRGHAVDMVAAGASHKASGLSTEAPVVPPTPTTYTHTERGAWRQHHTASIPLIWLPNELPARVSSGADKVIISNELVSTMVGHGVAGGVAHTPVNIPY